MGVVLICVQNATFTHSCHSLLSVIALGQLLPTAHQNSLPTNIYSGVKQTVVDINELYLWQILQTKPTIYVAIIKYVPTTVKCGGQLFWWAGGAKLDKSSPTCWSDFATRLCPSHTNCIVCFENKQTTCTIP